MALDTQQKRMSAASMGLPWMSAVFPVASPTEAWRLNVGLAYAGNALSAVTRTDDRTAVGRVMITFTSPGEFRVRTQRTGGSDDLQTVSGGSAITIQVIA